MAAIRTLLILLISATVGQSWGQSVVVIGNSNVRSLDGPTVTRIYTGRVIDLDGTRVTAVNATSGSSLRNHFLQFCLKQDEEKYTAYWTVRRYIGKGASPREFERSGEMINFVKSTPGAIGYIDEADLQSGLNVLLKCGVGSVQKSGLSFVGEFVAKWERALSHFAWSW